MDSYQPSPSNSSKTHLQRIQEEKNRLAKIQEEKVKKAKNQQEKIQQAKIHDTQKIRLQFKKETVDPLSPHSQVSTRISKPHKPTVNSNISSNSGQNSLDHGPNPKVIYSPLASITLKSLSQPSKKAKDMRGSNYKPDSLSNSHHIQLNKSIDSWKNSIFTHSKKPRSTSREKNISYEDRQLGSYLNFFQRHRRLILPVCLIFLYLIGTIYFTFHFLPTTVWSSFSLAFSTPDQASEKVQMQAQERPLIIKENNQELGQLKLGDLDPQVKVSKEEWQSKLGAQNQWFWPISFFPLRSLDIPLENKLEISEQKLKRLISYLQLSNENRPSSKDAYIEKANSQFLIKDEVQGTQVNPSSLQIALYKMLKEREGVLNLKDAYIPPQVKAKDQDILNRQAQIQKMLESEITLVVEEHKIKIPEKKIFEWIHIDDQGHGQVDKEAIENFILEEINYPYSSLFNTHAFMSTYQGEVTVQPGTFGWAVDRFTEADQIEKEIQAGTKIEREANIVGQGYQQEDEFGPNYVEIDLTHQMMLVYRDYELVLDTPIVSGKIGTDTVAGAYQVWNKESPSVLTGYNPHTELDYQQPVQYWIAIDDQAQGIHDANWQSNFGGQTYLQYGSLGCINTPPGVMPQVYDLVDYGMPVIIF